RPTRAFVLLAAAARAQPQASTLTPAARRQARAARTTSTAIASIYPIAPSRDPHGSNGLRAHDILPTKSTTAAATPCPHFAALLAAPSPTAATLEWLAASPDGCTKALMFANGSRPGLARFQFRRVLAMSSTNGEPPGRPPPRSL